MKKIFLNFFKKTSPYFEKIEKITYIFTHLFIFYIFFKIDYFRLQIRPEGLDLITVPLHLLEYLLLIFLNGLLSLDSNNPFRFLENFMSENTFNQWFGFLWEGKGSFTITNILFMFSGYFCWFKLIIPLLKYMDKKSELSIPLFTTALRIFLLLAFFGAAGTLYEIYFEPETLRKIIR